MKRASSAWMVVATSLVIALSFSDSSGAWGRRVRSTSTSAPAGALVGTYTGSVDIASAQVRWSF